MNQIFKKVLYIAMCAVLCFTMVSCSKDTVDIATKEPSPTATANVTPGNSATPAGEATATPTAEVTAPPTPAQPTQTPKAPVKTIFERCNIISVEGARQYEKNAAKQFYDFVSPVLDTNKNPSEADLQDASALNVYIGSVDNGISKGKWDEFNQNGYIIYAKDNNIVLRGNNAENTYIAVSRFINELMAKNADNISNIDLEKGLKIEHKAATREEYIADISKFHPVWQYEWQPPQWLMDFDEKLKSFTSIFGRPISYAHRGDIESYPENSIEAVISAVRRGADLIEIDVFMTRDKQLVLMHTSDLSITTDWLEKRGKVVNGVQLPTSAEISQWTYEQLCQLRLRTGNGTYADKNSEITDYMIPTLKEVFTVLKDRAFLVIDRLTSGYWSKVYDIIKETGNYTSFTYTTIAENQAEAEKYRKLMLDELGAAGPTCYKRGYAWSGDHYAEFSLKTDEDFEKYYRQQFNKGCFILTNKLSKLIEYIDKFYNPAKLG